MLQKEIKSPNFPNQFHYPTPSGLARPNLKHSGFMRGPKCTRNASVGSDSRGAEFPQPSAGKAASGWVSLNQAWREGKGAKGRSYLARHAHPAGPPLFRSVCTAASRSAAFPPAPGRGSAELGGGGP